jgi:hypothetical protein
MKATIFALSFAAIAAITSNTGANAFSFPSLAHDSSLTPVTYYGKGYSSGFGDYDYDRNRHYYRKNKHYHGYKHYHWNKYSRYGYRGYCDSYPYSWRCKYRSW